MNLWTITITYRPTYGDRVEAEYVAEGPEPTTTNAASSAECVPEPVRLYAEQIARTFRDVVGIKYATFQPVRLTNATTDAAGYLYPDRGAATFEIHDTTRPYYFNQKD